MAIIFKEELKKQRNLIYLFCLLVFIVGIVLWQGFFKKGDTSSLEEQFLITTQKVQIDFGIFENPIFDNLQPFEGLKIFPPEGETGRENPFSKR